MDTVEEIKSRLNIVDVVSRYIVLKKAGRNLKGICPFHNDTHPSFLVSPVKNFAWCFACQNGGDIFSFVQKIENISFPETVSLLAEWAGVVIEKNESGDGGKRKKEEKEVIREILSTAQSFFQDQLEKSPSAESYIVEKRKFSLEIKKTFGLGYAPNDFHTLENFLVQKGFSRKDLLSAGVLATKDERGESVYDKFRNRIMFPVLDLNGNICGFGGRALENEEPKYLNSPETPLYEKSKLIYGLSLAKKHIQSSGKVVIVEGNFDVLSCHQHGIQNAVAVSGTALTLHQVKMLQRFADKAVLAFDADTAGEAATLRALEVFFSAGMEVGICRIPGGKDPDEALQNNPEEFRSAILNPLSPLPFLCEVIGQKHDISTPKGKMNFLGDIFPFLEAFPSDLERREYFPLIATFLQMDAMMIEREFFTSRSPSLARKPVEKPIKSKEMGIREYAWGFFLAFPEYLRIFLGYLSEEAFQQENEKKFFVFLKDMYNGSGGPDIPRFLETLSGEERENLQKSILYAEEKCGHFSSGLLAKEAELLAKDGARIILSERVKTLSEDLRRTPTEDLKSSLRSSLLLFQKVHQ